VTVAPVNAVAADKTVKAGFNRFGRGNGFNQDPDLDHVARFPIVRGMSKARGDDNPQGVLVEDETVVHSEPPTKNSATQ
jgi:hypothetical protein